MFLMAGNGENQTAEYAKEASMIRRIGAIEGTPAEIKSSYFHWLCKLVGLNSAFDPESENFSMDPANPSYFYLAQMLYFKEFTPFVPHDDNREADGKALRFWFANSHSCYNNYECLNGPCTVLEMMVALAQRIDRDLMIGPCFDDRSAVWFWEMLSNLGISRYDDTHFSDKISIKIGHILDNLVDRKYWKNGVGSLFPMVEKQYLELFLDDYFDEICGGGKDENEPQRCVTNDEKSKGCVTKNSAKIEKSVTHHCEKWPKMAQKAHPWPPSGQISSKNWPVNGQKSWEKLEIWYQMQAYFQEFHIKIGENWENR